MTFMAMVAKLVTYGLVCGFVRRIGETERRSELFSLATASGGAVLQSAHS
jgi:hypothetical protein